MPSDNKQLILVIVPCIAVATLLLITAATIIRKKRRNTHHNSLPITETSFLQRHLDSIRTWNKPTNSGPNATFIADPNHLPFHLAQPEATHPPERTHDMTWQRFQEKQKQREVRTKQPSQPLEQWSHQPKGAAYWRQVGKDMQARKPWWEKARDRLGL
jgi:hypothetical protein